MPVIHLYKISDKRKMVYEYINIPNSNHPN